MKELAQLSVNFVNYKFDMLDAPAKQVAAMLKYLYVDAIGGLRLTEKAEAENKSVVR